jgi:hypothetical protein
MCAAAGAGLIVGWLLARKRGKVAGNLEGESIRWHDRLGERLGDGLDAAVNGLREVRERWQDVQPPDPATLAARLGAVDGARKVRMEHLGDGIVELTGASSDEASHAAAAAIARVPGVRAVVNHVWTPSSEVFGPN